MNLDNTEVKEMIKEYMEAYIKHNNITATELLTIIIKDIESYELEYIMIDLTRIIER